MAQKTLNLHSQCNSPDLTQKMYNPDYGMHKLVHSSYTAPFLVAIDDLASSPFPCFVLGMILLCCRSFVMRIGSLVWACFFLRVLPCFSPMAACFVLRCCVFSCFGLLLLCYLVRPKKKMAHMQPHMNCL